MVIESKASSSESLDLEYLSESPSGRKSGNSTPNIEDSEILDSKQVLLELLLNEKSKEIERKNEEIAYYKALGLVETQAETRQLASNSLSLKEENCETLNELQTLRERYKYMEMVLGVMSSQHLEELRQITSKYNHRETILRQTIKKLELELLERCSKDSSNSSSTMHDLKTKLALLESELKEAHTIIDLQHEKLVSKESLRQPVQIEREFPYKIQEIKKWSKKQTSKDMIAKVANLEETVESLRESVRSQHARLADQIKVNGELKELIVATYLPPTSNQDKKSELLALYRKSLK